eukprot:scaffold25926_cov99-Amphora_coffeaeformis.AAC.1
MFLLAPVMYNYELYWNTTYVTIHGVCWFPVARGRGGGFGRSRRELPRWYGAASSMGKTLPEERQCSRQYPKN